MNSLEINKTSCLSELLPYDTSTKTNGSLKTSLKEYNLLLVAAQEAMNAIKNFDLEQFDAVVGENACQIRAVKIAMLFNQYLKSCDLVQFQIKKAKQKVKELLQSINFLMEKGISFQNLLKEKELDVALTPDEIFLIESFLLSVAKTVKSSKSSSPLCRNDAADPKKLKNLEKDVSSSFTNSLLRKVRQLLSTASVNFVRQQADLLQDETLKKMCSKDFTIKYNTCWPCTPMFWTYKTLLLAAQKNQIPLVIDAKFLDKDKDYAVIKEESVFFETDTSSKDPSYKASIPYPKDKEKAAIVVQGVVCTDPSICLKKWKATIAEENLNVILAGAADHRQYPDPKEDQRIEILNNEELKKYREISKNNGYSLENPSVFFIQHVYPSTVGKLPHCMEKANIAEKTIESFLPGHLIEEWPKRAVVQILSHLKN